MTSQTWSVFSARWVINNLNLPKEYVISCIDVKIVVVNSNDRQPEENPYENHIYSRPIPGRSDLPGLRPEWFPAFHSAPTPKWRRGTVHGSPICLTLPHSHLRASGDRGGASSGESVPAPGTCHSRAGNRQHPLLSRSDGPERSPARPLSDGALGPGLRLCSVGHCSSIQGAVSGTELMNR